MSPQHLDYLIELLDDPDSQVFENISGEIISGADNFADRLEDAWFDTTNQLKRSILLDSGADLVSYGMGERSIIEIAEALDAGLDIKDITYIDGTVCKVKNLDSVYDAEILDPYEEMKKDKLLYAKSFYRQYCNTDPFSGKRLVEPYSDHLYVVQNPPAKPLTQGKEVRNEVSHSRVGGLSALSITRSRRVSSTSIPIMLCVRESA